jgi:hypothetical protein
MCEAWFFFFKKKTKTNKNLHQDIIYPPEMLTRKYKIKNKTRRTCHCNGEGKKYNSQTVLLQGIIP